MPSLQLSGQGIYEIQWWFKKLGNPDRLIGFTGTMSHKMLQGALRTVKSRVTIVERCRTSSLAVLRGMSMVRDVLRFRGAGNKGSEGKTR